MDTAYCMMCYRDSLPMGMLCRRSEVMDNGADRDPEIVSRYEGVCLKCCSHNHG